MTTSRSQQLDPDSPLRRPAPRVALAALSLAVLTTCTSAKRPAPGALTATVGAATPVVRRLTVQQYRNTITDLFGPGLTFPLLDEEPATGGFSTTGAAAVATSFQAVEQYLNAADGLARQVFTDDARRYQLVGCVPGTSAAADRACAARFLTRLTRAALRRDGTAEEQRRFLDLFTSTSDRRHDFWAGVRVATTALLASPSFIYVVERGRPQPDPDGHHRLTSFELATRLSLFLWNTTPDEVLLDAAARDELADDAGVRRHLERLLSSPRARTGLRDFFSELYRMDAVDAVSRDKEREPKVSVRAIGRKMKEETLMGLEHNVFVDKGDFRQLFTTRDTFLDKDLAALYRIKVMDGGMFTKIMLPPDSPRRGLLGQGSFLAGTSSPDKTSPTVRGKYIREVMLCEPIPPPPPNVDTNLPPADGEKRTLRERLEEHRLDFGCGKCHKLMDTIGLSFERFDSYGEYREKDNGAVIDETGDLDGHAFKNPAELSEMLSRDPRVPACLMRNLYSYATGRIPDQSDQRAIQALTAGFQKSGYQVLDALVALATSDAFAYLPVESDGAHPTSAVTARR